MQIWLRTAKALVSFIAAFMMILLLSYTLKSSGLQASNISGSSFSVNKSSAFPDSVLKYTVVISNSGAVSVTKAAMTDTLPVALDYESGSMQINLSGATTTASGVSSDVITWTGSLDGFGSATISYQAHLTDTLTSGDIVTNTVEINGDGTIVTSTAVTSVITETLTFLPFTVRHVPAPVLNSINASSGNIWVASWNSVASEVTGYQLQEASDETFSSPVVYDVGLDLSKTLTYAASTENYYCYRVRAFVGTTAGVWSNIECVRTDYFDDFSDDTTNWSIRREDTDDTDNFTYYENGTFVTKIAGRWDYAVASPLVSAPEPPYAIETRVKFAGGVDNLHTYGIVFGGDWNGGACPRNDYTSCFNHYYRFLALWYGSNNKLRIQLKRIDYHDASDNAGRGVGLVPYKDVRVGGDSDGWKTWRIEQDNGNIRIYVNGDLVAEAFDTLYLNGPYFGVFAASNEYLGTQATYDWYRVSSLP